MGDIFKYSLNENAVSGVLISLIDRIWFGGVLGHSSELLDNDDDDDKDDILMFSFHGLIIVF